MAALFKLAKLRVVVRSAAFWCVVLTGSRLLAASPDEVLTNASQIRNLTVADASHHLAVQLRGVVVTEAGPEGDRAVVIADESAGVYVLGPANSFSGVHRGDLLEVHGVTDPGEFAPIVEMKTIHNLGTGPLPKAQEVTFEQMIAGSLDGQLVEVSGVVRSWEPITATMNSGFGTWNWQLAVGV
jgi:hypothetical protein